MSTYSPTESVRELPASTALSEEPIDGKQGMPLSHGGDAVGLADDEEAEADDEFDDDEDEDEDEDDDAEDGDDGDGEEAEGK